MEKPEGVQKSFAATDDIATTIRFCKRIWRVVMSQPTPPTTQPALSVRENNVTIFAAGGERQSKLIRRDGAVEPAETRSLQKDPGHLGRFGLAGFPVPLLLPVLPHNCVPQGFDADVRGKAPGAINITGDAWFPLKKWRAGIEPDVKSRSNAAGANCGLLLGKPDGRTQFVFIDIDAEPHPDRKGDRSVTVLTIKALQKVLGAPFWVRLTRPGRAGVLLRLPADEPAGRKAIAKLRDAGGVDLGKIEFLAHGQQVVVGGMHPWANGTPIQWFRTDRRTEMCPAPKLDDAMPTVASREIANAAMSAIHDVLRADGIEVSVTGHSSVVAEEELPAEDRAPPSAAKLAAVFDRMPNPASIERDQYVTVMFAASGCIRALYELDRLGPDDTDLIAQAAIGWAERWEGVSVKEGPSEAEKWESDFARNPATRMHCWDHIRTLAIKLGDDELRIESAQDDFEATEEVPPSGMRERTACTKPGLVLWPAGFRMVGHGLLYEVKDEPSVWVCDRFEVKAEVRSPEGSGWALALAFRDRDGRDRKLTLPRSLAHRDPRGIAEQLEDAGLSCAPGQRSHHLMADAVTGVRVDPSLRQLLLDRTGWHDDSKPPFFAHPTGRAFGLDAGIALAGGPDQSFRARGTIEGWRDGVAAPAIGNSRLAFSVSLAFAGPLLVITGEPNGGFHLCGPSRRGKTAAAIAAASLWGDPQQLVRSWRGTGNGIEAVAARAVDGLLVLDELQQADAREVGDIVYAVANGAGKARATTTGAARRTKTWRNLLLSTGEITLAEKMRQADRAPAAGQDVRLPAIPAGEARHGLFETLHDAPSGPALTEAIKRAATDHHGHAAASFLERLAIERLVDDDALRERLLRHRADFVAANVPAGADGQVISVAGRFGLVAAAGELATAWGITGWPAGEATRAAAACCRDWLVARGSAGAGEGEKAIEAIRGCLERHGHSRFVPLEAASVVVFPTEDSGPSVTASSAEEEFEASRDRVRPLALLGYRGKAGRDAAPCFLFTSSGLAEACRPVAMKRTVEELDRRGLLAKEERQRATVRRRVRDGGRPNLYAVRAAILDGEDQ